MLTMQHANRILAATLLALLMGTSTAAETSATSDTKPLPSRLPLNELRVFAEAFDRVSSAYVEEI